MVQHGRAEQIPAFNLLRRLRDHAIRMPKVKQKISGCFRTLKGAENFAIIRSYLGTLHKQGHNLIEVLRLAFQGNHPQPATG